LCAQRGERDGACQWLTRDCAGPARWRPRWRALTAGRGLPRAEGVGDEAVLQVALPASRDGELVAHGVAETAALPAHAGPLGPDGAVDGPGPGGRRPVDGAVVGEVVEPADAVRRGQLVSDGVAEEP